jgi:hypothetical protein
MNLMKFPDQWEQFGMYPDELFNWQMSGYEQGHEEGSEHDRNGAFHWWLKRNPSKSDLKNLLQLTYLDPDPALGSDVRSYIRNAEAFDMDLASLDRRLGDGS